MIENPQNLINRLQMLEAALHDQQSTVNDQQKKLIELDQTVNDPTAEENEPGHQNFIRNGDLDHTRNTYLFLTDFTDADVNTVDADVSEEAAHFYAHQRDTAIESTGSINATSKLLEIDTPDFLLTDEDVEIVVEGAGAAGADLVTTIDLFTDDSNVQLMIAADTSVVGARVRWRLQQLREDATDDDVDANPATNSALKTPDHSRYADAGIISNPDFDKAGGFVRIGAAATVDVPLPQNYCRDSKQYILSFIFRLQARVTDGAMTATSATLESATMNATADDEGKTVTVKGAGAAGADLVTTIESVTAPNEIVLADPCATSVTGAQVDFQVILDNATAPRLEVGIYDNTAGQRRYLEGEPLELTASAKGAPASTVSRDYFVVAMTNWGETIGTEIVTVANAPADGHFSANDYVALSWTRVEGAIGYDVYRKTGSVFKFLKRVYPQNEYFDKGATTDRPLTEFPALDFRRPRAFVRSTQHNFTPTTRWQATQFNIPVPVDYDIGRTTGKQWVRIGLSGAFTGIGMHRALQIDLISLDDKRGAFQRCPLDFFAKRNVSVTAGTGQGTTGTGGSDFPGGSSGCPTLDMTIETEVFGGREEMSVGAFYNLWEMYGSDRIKIVNRKGDAVKVALELQAPQLIYKLVCESGEWLTGSKTHPVFAGETDDQGKPLQNIRFGDNIQTKSGASVAISCIIQPRKRTTVKISIIEGEEKGYYSNDIAGHNAKPVPTF